MASTYSTSLRLNLMGTGDQSGTWGTTTNVNLGTLLEQGITGVATISIAGLTSYPLTANNGATDQSRNAAIIFTGTLTGNCTILTPTGASKLYIIANTTSGGYSLVMQVNGSSGTTITIPNGKTVMVYTDATNFYQGPDYVGPLGTMSTQNASSVAITGGTIAGTTISTSSVSTSSLTGTGGTIDNTPIGGTTAAAGSFTTLGATGAVTFGNSTLNIPTTFTLNSTGAVVLPKGTTAQEPTGVAGMIRFNSQTGNFEGYNGLVWGSIGGGNSTASGLWQNAQSITANQTITSGYSATSAGPITVAGGVTITVPSGSRWVVL